MPIADVTRTINIVASDGTVWLEGNGTWVDGDNPGAPTFNTLQGLVTAIGTAGGWREIPNTRLFTHLITDAELNAIDPFLKDVAGSKALMNTWGGGGFDGKSFLLGAVGGHNAYNGNELYRVRLSDPPAACRMYDPWPLVLNANGLRYPEWGPQSLHTYGGTMWDTKINRFIHSGNAGSLPARQIWAFNPDASTPLSAWVVLSPPDAVVGSATDYPNFPCVLEMSDTEMYVTGTSSNPRYFAVDYETGLRRVMTKPPDPWIPSQFTSASFGYTKFCRAVGIAFWSIVGASGSFSVYYVRAFNIAGGGSSSPATNGPGNTFPNWATFNNPGGVPVHPDSGIGYRTIEGTADGLFALGWHGDHRVWCWDRVANVMNSFETLGSPPQPTYPEAGFGGFGIQMGRWAQCVRTTPTCFVGLNSSNQNAWVFRPPAAWGIV